MTTPEFTPEVQAYIDSKIAAGIEAANAPAPELTSVESDAAIDAIRAIKREEIETRKTHGPPTAFAVAAWRKEFGRSRSGPLSAEEFNIAYRKKFGRDPGK